MKARDQKIGVNGAIPVQADGKIATCETCGRDAFYLFRVLAQDHWHAQCAWCGAVACTVNDECFIDVFACERKER